MTASRMLCLMFQGRARLLDVNIISIFSPQLECFFLVFIKAGKLVGSYARFGQ